MTVAEGDKLLRIGELSRRVGVPVESLRAWERRYGLLAPSRTQGGFRLYGEADVARVLAMRANLDRGMSAAEAARLALAEEMAAGDGVPCARGGRSGSSAPRSTVSTRPAPSRRSTGCSPR